LWFVSVEPREAALPTRHRLSALVLAALAGVLVQGVVAGTLLMLLLRAGLVPSGVWPVTVVAGAWIGAEISGRYRVSRLAGGLIASLPVLFVTTLLALHARMGELGPAAQALVLVTVVLLNGLFAFVGIWAAGVRARWAANRRAEVATGTGGAGGAGGAATASARVGDRTPAARERVRPPVAKTPIMRPGE
jgi:hypothetical protein